MWGFFFKAEENLWKYTWRWRKWLLKERNDCHKLGSLGSRHNVACRLLIKECPHGHCSIPVEGKVAKEAELGRWKCWALVPAWQQSQPTPGKSLLSGLALARPFSSHIISLWIWAAMQWCTEVSSSWHPWADCVYSQLCIQWIQSHHW